MPPKTDLNLTSRQAKCFPPSREPRASPLSAFRLPVESAPVAQTSQFALSPTRLFLPSSSESAGSDQSSPSPSCAPHDRPSSAEKEKGCRHNRYSENQ